jgi:DNA invertase Pin-like site-specific DNA recombinase
MDVTQRGQLSLEDVEQLKAAAQAVIAYRRLVLEKVAQTSYREVARVTGISTTTLQRWKREAEK